MPAMILQCAMTCVFGCFGFWLVMDDPNPKVPLLSGLIFGFGGTWLAMKGYFWARYGRATAKSMTLEP